MGILDSFKTIDDSFNEQLPTYDQFGRLNYGDPEAVQEDVSRYQNEPPIYYPNVDDIMDNNNFYSAWCCSNPIINHMNNEIMGPIINPKLDPNKIFNSDTVALRNLAADQTKIVKMFEKKLMESLTDKGKFGLDENDIEAMSALTAARSAITSIQKEQIAIKKNIADLKIKQSQVNNAVERANGQQAMGGGASMSANDIGRNILDNIFEMGGVPVSVPQNNGQYQTIDDTSQSSVLDDLIAGTISPTIQYENNDPKTYVLVGNSDSDVEFVTYDSMGNEIPDFPNPTSRIDKVDRESMTATDDLLVSYPVKLKYS